MEREPCGGGSRFLAGDGNSVWQPENKSFITDDVPGLLVHFRAPDLQAFFLLHELWKEFIGCSKIRR
jgi:hypothetical protein